jgi:hypothetical protein
LAINTVTDVTGLKRTYTFHRFPRSAGLDEDGNEKPTPGVIPLDRPGGLSAICGRAEAPIL